MNKKQALRQARDEVLAGKDRREVFEAYKPYVPRPLHLAAMINGIVDPERKSRYRVLNIILLVLLILAAVGKFFALFGMAQEYGVGPALALALLGLVIPVLCAIGVARFEGQIYLILPIFCVAGLLQIFNHFQGDWFGAAIDAGFILLIMVLSIILKIKLFPNLGLRGVKRDTAGNIIF